MGENTQDDLIATVKQMISAGVPQQEQGKIPSDFAAMGALQKDAAEGKNPREVLYQSLMKPDDQIEQSKAALLKQMQEDQPMSKSQIAAMLFIGIMPMLAGGLLKGKKGLAAGANAGAIGATTMGSAIASENKEDRATSKLAYADLSQQQRDQAKFKQDVQLNELKSMDQAQEKALDRGATLQAASIRAGGDAAVGKGLANIAKGLDIVAQTYKNDKLSREDKSAKQPLVVGDKAFVPTGAVSDETATGIREAAGKYSTALSNINDIVEMSKAMDLPAFQRSMGDTSSDIYQKYTLAQNAIMDAKKIPGLKGTEATTNLDKLLSNPSSLINNLYKSLPGTSSLRGEYENASKNIQKDFDDLLKLNKFTVIEPGQKVTINGETVTVGKVYPDGTFDPVEK